MHRKASPILFALIALLASCGWPSWPTPTAEPGAFAIYLLEGNLSPKEIAGLDLADLPLQDEPVLAQDDLEAYVWDRHELVLTPEAIGRIEELEVPVSGLAFVVAVGPERIYQGAFWVPWSSLSYEGVVIQLPPIPPSRRLRIQLAYPASPELFAGQDPRFDPRIREALGPLLGAAPPNLMALPVL
jgi:hypothetical protein